MSTKSLAVLIDETAALEHALVESQGEITPEIEAMLAVKDTHLPEKVDAYAMVIERMDTIFAFYRAKAELFNRMAKAAEAVSNRCEYNLKTAMETLHTDEIKGHDIKFKLLKSNPAVEIEDDSKLDPAYLITETVTKVDKKRIVEDLKLGVPVAGAKLRQSFALRKYVNTPTSTKKVSGK